MWNMSSNLWYDWHVKLERFRRRQNKKLQLLPLLLLLQYFHFLKRLTSKNNSSSHSWDMLSWNGKVGLAGYPKKDNKSIRVHISDDAVGVLELFMKRIVSWIQTVFVWAALCKGYIESNSFIPIPQECLNPPKMFHHSNLHWGVFCFVFVKHDYGMRIKEC